MIGKGRSRGRAEAWRPWIATGRRPAVLAAILCRHRPFAFPTTVGIAAVAAGFATATVKREIIAHPVLSAPAWNAELAGFVEAREERERSDVPISRVSTARISTSRSYIGQVI